MSWALVVLIVAVAVTAQTGLVNLHVVTSSSMRPALEVGDLLVARTIPAERADVGSIATLRHPDGEMVTHRVLANDPDPDGPGRLITMRGDDNDVADAVPYAVENVDATLVRVPLLGGAIQALWEPPVRYVAVASLALLVIGSLLPRSRRDGSETTPPARGGTGA